MPILAAEPQIYPENLLEPAEPDLLDHSWWVLHCRPRQEKSLARQLRQSRVAHYLPQVEKKSVTRGRSFTSNAPLFTSYLFLLARSEERVRALATGRVVGSLCVANQELMWHDLRQIHQLIASGEPITQEDRLAAGACVEICNGPLTGLEGKIIEVVKAGRRFVVEVDFIHKAASVFLDESTVVKPIG